MLLNFYLSFLRRPLHEAIGNVTGIPIFGSLAIWIGAPLISSYPVAMWTALALSLLDTGGLLMFLMMLAIQCRTPPDN